MNFNVKHDNEKIQAWDINVKTHCEMAKAVIL